MNTMVTLERVLQRLVTALKAAPGDIKEWWDDLFRPRGGPRYV